MRTDGMGGASACALDAPIWAALHGTHAPLSEGDGLARRYPAAFAPFAAMGKVTPEAYEALAAIVPEGGQVALFTTDALVPPSHFDVISARDLIQMVDGGGSHGRPDASSVVALEAEDAPEMMGLATLTKPGPFAARTRELGRYVGVRLGGKLVAMAGERLRFLGHVEISAVCVHPRRRGLGLANLLVSTLSEAARGRGELAFLHVFADNAPAIALYDRLGFRTRRHLLATRLLRVAR